MIFDWEERLTFSYIYTIWYNLYSTHTGVFISWKFDHCDKKYGQSLRDLVLWYYIISTHNVCKKWMFLNVEKLCDWERSWCGYIVLFPHILFTWLARMFKWIVVEFWCYLCCTAHWNLMVFTWKRDIYDSCNFVFSFLNVIEFLHEI